MTATITPIRRHDPRQPSEADRRGAVEMMRALAQHPSTCALPGPPTTLKLPPGGPSPEDICAAFGIPFVGDVW